MDISLLKKVLGLSVEEEETISAFNRYGIDLKKELHLSEGDYRTYLDCETDGICYVFTDEGVFFNNEDQIIGQGPLYLSSVFLYSEGTDGYKQYSKALPFDLDFTDSIDAIHAKLGAPHWDRKDDGSVISERWDVDSFRVHLFYSENQTPNIISIEYLPPKFSETLIVKNIDAHASA
jgi:hypothetical protein